MKKRIYIDMDDTLCDYAKAQAKARIINPNQPYPQCQFGFFIGLEPIKDAIEAFKYLSENYDVWILTRPSTKNINCYSEKAYWVKEFLGEEAVERLILCPDKSLLMGDYLIDDFYWEFNGELIQFGTSKYPDWKTVINYIDKNG